MHTRTLMTMMLTSLATSAFAEIRLPNIISDHMVLQRDAKVAIWGSADRGETVTIEFAGQKKSAETDKKGKWLIHLDPMKASDTGRTLAVREQGTEVGDRIEIRNVLVGEVWLCSGQSNMTWSFMGRVKNKQRVIDSANRPLIRYASVKLTGKLEPVDDCPVFWQVTTPDKVKRYSCVPYYFALRLHEELGVPVGVIITFDHVGEGLTSAKLTLQETAEPSRGGPSREWEVEVKEPDSEELTGFAIFEADRDSRNAPVPFHRTVPAKAKITGKDIVEVWSDEIEIPVGVRYAWVGFPKANLYNRSGLPTLPFRTDKLKLQIQARKERSWKSRQ